jgi:hypothetical protein
MGHVKRASGNCTCCYSFICASRSANSRGLPFLLAERLQIAASRFSNQILLRIKKGEE